MPEIKLLFITIPRLTANRYQEISSIFSKDFLQVSLSNFTESMKLFIGQSNDHPWNLISFFGLTYVFSLPFTLIGIYNNFSKENRNEKINLCFNIWFIAAFLLLIVCEPNTNRCNVFIIPLIYYTISGIALIIENVPKTRNVIIAMYLVAFICFSYTYFYKGYKEGAYFETDIGEMVEYVDDLDVDKIYIDKSFTEPYIYVLLYSEYSAKDFDSTVEYFTQGENFEQVKSFGKYNFYIPENIGEENAVYVVQNSKDLNELDIDDSEYKITKLQRFTIIEKKE